MNKYHIVALILIVGAIALRSHLDDTALTVAIGAGLVLTAVGLFQMKRKA